MNLAIYLITAGVVLLLGVYLLLRFRQGTSSSEAERPPVSVNLASATDAVLVTAGYGKIAYANPQARQWFDLNGGDPDLELMAEAVHPADTFRDLFAMEGRASFRIGSRRVEAASHRLPGDARQMVVVLRDLAAARSEAGPEASRALVALSEIGLAISRNAPFEETLSAILTSLSQAITCDAASIVTLNDQDGSLRPIASRGNDMLLNAMHTAGGTGVHAGSFGDWVRTYHQPLLVEDGLAGLDVAGNGDGNGGAGATLPFRSYIGTPLRVGDEFLGLVQLVARQPGCFNHEDLALLESVANQTAAVIDKARVLEEKRRRTDELTGIQAIALAGMDAGNYQVLFDRLTTSIAQACDVEICGILMHDPVSKRLVAQSPFHGLPESLLGRYRIALDEGTVAQRLWQRDDGWSSNWVRDEALVAETGLLDLFDVLGVRSIGLMPLVVGRRRLGMVQISNRRDGQPLGPRDMQQLQVFAAQAAIAIESIQLSEREQQRGQEFDAVRRISQTIGRATDFEAIYPDLSAQIAAALAVEFCGVLLFRPEEQALAPVPPVYGLDASLLEYLQIPAAPERGLRRLLEAGDTWLCNDLSRDPLAAEVGLDAQASFVGLTQLLLVPLLVSGEPIGAALAANKRGQAGFTDGDGRLLNIFAAQMAVVLANDRLQSESQARRVETRLFQRVAALVRAEEPLDQTIDQVLAELAEFFKSDVAFVDFLESDSGRLVIEARHAVGLTLDAPLVMDAYSYGFEKSVVASGEPFLSNDTRAGLLPEYQPLTAQLKLRQIMLAPLQIGGQGVGELAVANRRSGDYTPADLDVLFTVAMQLSTAVERARLIGMTDRGLLTRVAVLDALGRVSNELNLTVELERILSVIRQEALRVTEATDCTLLMLSPREEWADLDAPEVLLRTGAVDKFSESAPIEAAAMARRGEVYVPDYAGSDLAPAPAEAVSALAVPAYYGEKLVSLVHVYADRPDAFDEEIRGFVTALVNKASIAYGNAARFREQISRGQLLSRRVEQLNQIFELSQVLRTAGDLEEVMEAVAVAIQVSAGFSVVLVSLLDEEKGVYRRVAQAGIPLAQFEEIRQIVIPRNEIEGLLRKEYQISQSYFLPAEEAEDWEQSFTDREASFYYHREYYGTSEGFSRWHPDDALVVPLRDSRGATLGILSVDAPVDGRRPVRSTIEPLEIFAHQAAIAIENFRLLETSQREATIARQERDVLERLYAVSSEIQSASDVPTRLQVVAKGIRDAGWKRVHITLRDEHLEPTALFYAGYTDAEADQLHANLTPGPVWRRRMSDPDFYNLGVGAAFYLRYDAPWVVKHTWEGEVSRAGEPVPADRWHPRDELYLPIYGAENRLIGLIGMDTPADGAAPTAERMRPIELFASQAASAIEMTRLYLETSRSAEQEALFNEIMRAVTSALDIDRVIESVADGLQRLIPFTRLMVAFYAPDLPDFEILEARFVSANRVQVKPSAPLPVEGTALGAICREQQGHVYFLDEQGDDLAESDLRAWWDAGEFTSMLVPMVAGGSLMGILALNSELSHSFGFDEANIAVVERVANLAAVAIENARLYQQTAERERFSASLARLSGELNATLDLSATLQSVCRESLDILGVDGAYIWQAEGGDLVGIAGVGPGQEAFIGRRIAQDNQRVLDVRVYTRQIPMYINDVTSRTDLEIVLGDFLTANAIMGVPLLREGSALGVLSLVKTGERQPFTPSAMERAAIFATQASIALENARLYQETRDLQRFTNAVVESIQQGIVVVDRAGRITTCNAYMQAHFGWDDESIGRLLFDYRPDYVPMLAQGLQAVLTTGEPRTRFSVPGANPDGQPIVLNFYLYPLKETADVTGAVVLVEDVTEQSALEADLAARADQLTALTEVSSRLTANLEPDDVVREVLDQLGQVLEFDGVTLWLRQANDLQIRAARGYAGGADELVGLSVAIEDSVLFREMAERRQSLNVPDVVGDPRFPGGEQRLNRNWLGAPLISKGEIIGLLALEKAEPGYYTENHAQLALAFANQAAVALENAQLFADARDRTSDLEQQTSRLRLLNRVSTLLAQSLDIENILEVALQESLRAVDGMNFGRAVMFAPEHQVGSVVVTVPRGDAPPSELIPLDNNPVIDYLRRTLKPMVVENFAQHRQLAAVQTGYSERGVASAVFVPLTVGGQVIGMLSLEHIGEPYRIASSQVELVQTIATQAAIAVQNANLLEQSFVRTRELETLFEASQATSLTLDLDEVIRSVAQQVLHALEADACTVMLWDEVEQNLVVYADVNREGDPARSVEAGTIYALPDYPARLQALEERRVTIIRADEAPADGRELAEMNAAGVGALMLVPLVVRDQSIGLIAVKAYGTFRSFGLSEQRIARTLAGQAAIAIENARLNTETAAQVQEAFMINDLSQAVSAAVDMRELLPIVRSQVPSLTNAEWFYLALYDEEKDILSFPVAVLNGKDVDMAPRNRARDEFSWILRNNRSLLLVGSELPEVRRNLSIETVLPDVRSFLGVPLAVGAQAVGVLAVADNRPNRIFGLNDQRILYTVAGQLAVAIQNARLFAELRRFNQQLEQRVRVQTEEIRAERDRLNTLYTITAEMSSTLDIDRVLARALELLAGAVGANLGTILLIDHQTETLFKRAELGRQIIEPEPVQALTSHQGLAGWMIEHREPLVIDDVQEDPRWVRRTPDHAIPRATLAVLLETSDDIQGLLFLYSDRPGVFNQDHLRLVMAATSQLATSISNAELYRYIREQADRLGEMVREQQVEASKSNSILEGVADGVVVSDEDGAIILFNSAAERILEIKRDRVLSRPIATLSGLYGGGGRRWMDAIQRWMENPASIRVGDYLSETLELEEKVVNVMLAPVHMGDQFLGTVSVLRDITRDVEVDRMKTDFISNVSHELRTPMTSIKGYADLLVMGAAGEVSDRQREFLSTIKNNADRLSNLVNDLLNISRIDSGRVELNMQPVNMVKLLRSVSNNLAGRIRNDQKSISVIERIAEDLPLISADAEKLTQIMTNLVDNAYQYTPEGGKITLAVYLEDASVVFSVSDTGIGIPKKYADRIFDRFFRNDEHPLVMETPGTGLGLAIVKELVDMQGGRIWFDSEEGRGTTFFVAMPVADGSSPETAAQAG